MEADVRTMKSEAGPFEREIRLLIRDAVLHDAALYFDGCDLLFEDPVRFRCVLQATQRRLTFLASEGRWRAAEFPANRMLAGIYLPVPGFAMRKQLWDGCAS